MSYISKEKLFTKEWFKVWFLIVFGTFIMAVGFVLFISPYKLAPGGVYGIAIILHHLFGFPIGLSGLLMDIPLTIIGIRILGPKFGIKTILGFIMLSAFITLLELTWGYEPLVEGDALLSSIFGGILIGVGLGFVFRSKASSGGSDIIAMILAKYTRLPVGQLLIYVDATIVLFGLLAFEDWKIPLYSWVVIFICGKVIDITIQGVSYDKTLFIISDKHELIRDKLINDIERGGTYISGKGMFQGQEKKIIFTNVSRREVHLLRSYIVEVDPEAFITVIDANEILGNGFKPIREE
jgi:uncharacterized membrane-anchored protein YitT (DUF2179 family)